MPPLPVWPQASHSTSFVKRSGWWGKGSWQRRLNELIQEYSLACPLVGSTDGSQLLQSPAIAPGKAEHATPPSGHNPLLGRAQRKERPGTGALRTCLPTPGLCCLHLTGQPGPTARAGSVPGHRVSKSQAENWAQERSALMQVLAYFSTITAHRIFNIDLLQSQACWNFIPVSRPRDQEVFFYVPR